MRDTDITLTSPLTQPNAHRRLEPKLVAILRAGYSRRLFLHDLAAELTVGVVALPLAIAFAIASGVKPEQGLYTAIIAGFVIAVLGGTRAQVSGPTGAFIVIIYGIVQQHGYRGLAVATLIAGLVLICMGLLRMGALLKFIPYPVTVGFTSGIAVVIFSSQTGYDGRREGDALAGGNNRKPVRERAHSLPGAASSVC